MAATTPSVITSLMIINPTLGQKEGNDNDDDDDNDAKNKKKKIH